MFEMARNCSVRVNGGTSKGRHPTQALRTAVSAPQVTRTNLASTDSRHRSRKTGIRTKKVAHTESCHLLSTLG